jgi:glyceraldehyde 3-phosphate dehydrogenase
MNNRKIKVGINGFGRIGRAIFRQNINKNVFDVVVINDLNSNIENLAYQLKYDSTHGVLVDDKIEATKDHIIFNDHRFRVFSKNNIEDIPWSEYGVDVIIGCTGVLKNVENAHKCIKGSVKKVIFSDSPRQVDFTLVMGINEEFYDPQKHNILAGSICDVVGAAPLLKLLVSNFSINSGFMLTLHPWLVYQNILDGNPNPGVIADPNGTPHAIGRGSALSLLPKNTSLVGALERAMPNIKDKFKAMSYRVPTEIVGTLYSTITFDEKISTSMLKEVLSKGQTPPYFEYSEEPLVSIDYKHHRSSCVLDGKWIEIVNSNTARFVTWYDNEWGYTARFVEAVRYISEKE